MAVAVSAFYHSGGGLYRDGEPLTFSQARASRAFEALRLAAARRDGEIERQSLAAVHVRQITDALHQCADWRRAAGWAQPELADRRVRP